MTRVNQSITGALVLLAATLAAGPASAQVDIAGSWGVRYHEDIWHRQAGPEIGDYTGVPINDDARQMANTFAASIWSQRGFQCRPHQAPYAMRGPANLRITKHTETPSERLVAYEIYGTFGGGQRMIWMDGRPHPSEYARHSWMGFSTGKWDGDMLTVYTTHLKKGYIQRNGIDSSDQTTMTEHFFRYGDHGEYLTLVSIVNDPVYLAEPFVRSTDWALSTNMSTNPNARGGSGECGTAETVDEVANAGKDYVPHFLPGTNDDQLHEVSKKYNIPFEATQGGPETTYPEYQIKLKQLMDAARAKEVASARTPASRPGETGFFGTWRLDRTKSTFTESKKRTGPLGVDATAVEWRVMKIESAGDGLRHTTDTRAIANDTGFFREQYTAKFDGKDYPIDLKSTFLDAVALKKIDANTIERAGKVGGQTVETATWKVSPDGKTLIVTTKGKVPGGIDYNSVQVFNRE